MAFNSSLFILAFIGFYSIYTLLAKKPAYRIGLILIFNALFYWLLSKWGILIITGIGISDFLIAKQIHATKSEKQRRLLLYTSLTINIGLLLTFRHFTQWFSLSDWTFWPMVAGISFYVFRTLGYVMDVYHENIEQPEDNPAAYLAYIGFFPLILQGPISPAREFLPELKSGFNSSAVQHGRAFFLLISGVIKKFCLANFLTANFTERVFDNPHLFTGMENLFAAIAQAMVVYLDFSGYTDLMLGIGLLLGFNLSENFNFPYTSANITEYWRRWHMSLSKWLNEYLFFPLSFSLRSLKMWGTVIAVFITFIISGFWHGTSLNYTFWGALHGIALVWDVISAKWRSTWKSKLPTPLYTGTSVLLTFAFLVFSGIFFRQENMTTATEMIIRIFTDRDWSIFGQWLNDFSWVFAVMINTIILHWLFPEFYEQMRNLFEKSGWIIQSFLLVTVIFIAWQISGMEPVPFIYQKF